MYDQGGREEGVQFVERCRRVKTAPSATAYAQYAVAVGYFVGVCGVSPVKL
jgi:hypothetical protein